MKTKFLLLTTFLMLAFSLNEIYGQWNVFKCETLPENSFPVWVKKDVTPGVTDGPASVLTFLEDDPDITGNKFLRIEELLGDKRESWKQEWEIADSSVGVTVVLRTKPSPGILAIAAADGNDYRFLYVSPRNGANYDELKYDYPDALYLEKNDAPPVVTTSTDWHIYRITLKIDQLSVYLDEDPTAIMSGTTSKTSGDNMLKFGDNSTGGMHGAYYDWIIWDLSGAYAPGEGTALPDDLTGLGGSPSSIKDNLNASGDHLSSFPNPFTSSTTIAYRVETTSLTRIDIYDVTGKLVKNLVNELKVPGEHNIKFNAEDLPAGLYFCQMRSGEIVSNTKMMIR